VALYLREPGWKRILFGEWMLTEEFDALMARVQEERDELNTLAGK
jgi:hypothetical protein